MKNISFALTTDAILARRKTVTRRTGWATLKPGTLLQPVAKAMGLRPGEKIQMLGPPIRVVSVRRERLDEITTEDVEREGFEGRDALWFVEHFCEHMSVPSSTLVTRIEFEYT